MGRLRRRTPRSRAHPAAGVRPPQRTGVRRRARGARAAERRTLPPAHARRARRRPARSRTLPAHDELRRRGRRLHPAGCRHARGQPERPDGAAIPADRLRRHHDRGGVSCIRRLPTGAGMTAPGSIRIVGPRDRGRLPASTLLINTTSHSASEWTTELSPFHLGPCRVSGGHEARRMENAWQFSKVWPDQVGADGNPTEAYWTWAKAGWRNDRPVRYPRGKGAKPAYLWWHGEKLAYVPGRLRAYWPLYRDAVRETAAFARLRELVAGGQDVALFDFDGYDHDSAGVPLRAVLLDETRPMGHAFVLKALLLFGDGVAPEQVLETADLAPVAAAASPQLSFF
ncbi:hypothetical protein Mpe_B0216 (plasmid) [Methylibium petroleiphilum PM1]|uniref:Uncharacterized protein n=2 Tax=Methylibium TaxID=316612 RepID=A2SN52_METPP|nr:hypothetical protein Mpe_B0216 [Methylibium petroleiphilum PM1]